MSKYRVGEAMTMVTKPRTMPVDIKTKIGFRDNITDDKVTKQVGADGIFFSLF
jgi:hypothetical protein